jgi:hypothetical protein
MGDPVLAWAIFGAGWIVLLAVNVRRSRRRETSRAISPDQPVSGR